MKTLHILIICLALVIVANHQSVAQRRPYQSVSKIKMNSGTSRDVATNPGSSNVKNANSKMRSSTKGPSVIRPSIAKNTAENVYLNSLRGTMFESKIKRYLGDVPHAVQVPLRPVKEGARVRVDFLSRDKNTGNYHIIEAKSGNARLTPNQKTGFPAIEKHGAIVGKNVDELGLKKGDHINPSIEVRRSSFPTSLQENKTSILNSTSTSTNNPTRTLNKNK